MKYVKHPIPEEISDKGGASVQLVQKQTIPLDGAIDAAIEAHYAIGQKEFIRNGVLGMMKSMAAGVRRDGRARSIDGFLTVYPVFKGAVDVERGYDPAVNKVQIRARLLNELELDISNWSFEDVTPGKRAFKVGTVKAGSVIGVVETGSVIEVNGDGLPSTKAGEELRVHWEVEGTDKSGDIPAAKITSDVGRADIAADALDELADAEYDGKTIVFTVRGNFSSAKISAKLKVLPTRGNFKGIEVKQFEMERIDCKIAADQIEGLGAFAGWTADGGTLHISVPDSLDPYDKDVTFTKNSDGDFVGTAQLEGFTLNQRHGTATITLKPDADPTSVNTAAFVVELAE